MNANSTDQKIIPLSKNKILLLLLLAFGFVVGGIWLCSFPESQSRYDPLFAKIIGVFCILFFGFGGIYGIGKLFDLKPGLILDSIGIIDNSSATSIGRILLQDITDIEISKIASQKFLTLIVTNPNKYIRMGGLINRKLMAVNLKWYGSPIHISSNSLKINFAELCDLVVEFHHKYGNAEKGDPRA